jgi:Protein of unknown function (DUF2914)
MNGTRYEAVLAFVSRHERLFATTAFLVGFVTDLLTFTLLPLNYVVTLFAAYIVLAMVATIAAHHAVGTEGRFAASITTFAPLIAHFVLGSILCGFLILLTQSGTVLVSWPFLLLVAVVFLGNEALHTYRRHFIFQTLLLYGSMLALAVIAAPLYTRSLTQGTFLGGVTVAAVTFALYMLVVCVVRWERIRPALLATVAGATAITVILVGAYTLRLIPPIPLSLRDSGVYSKVERIGDRYVTEGGRARAWWDLRPQSLSLAPGAPAYVYTAIFAPGALSVDVVHVWQREIAGAWHTESTVAFSMTGGRDEGYRGYSMKSAPAPGNWRVLVQTGDGRTIGDLRFRLN